MNDNSNDFGEVLRNRYNDISLSSTILIVIGAIIGIVGNCTVIFFYFIRIKERGERYFIPLLAIVDLVACLTSASFYIMDNTFFYNYPNNIVCRLLTFLQVFVPGFSAHILLIVCLQRYLLVCKPFGPKMTLLWKRVAFAAACLFPLLYSGPLLGISGIKTTDEIFLNRTVQTTICKFSAVDTSAKITAYFGFLGLIIVANIIITAALYIPVLRRIHISLSKKTTKSVFYKINDGNTSSNIESTSQPTKTSSIDSGTQPSVSNPTNQIVVETTEYDSKPNEMCRNKEFTNVCSNKEPFREDLVKNNHVDNAVKTEEIMAIDNEIKHDGGLKSRNDSVKRRITIMFFVIILAYIISYIPAVIILILSYAIDDFNFITLTKGETIAWIYLARFVFLNHIVNPFIYSYFDVKFRTELKTFFLCKRNQRSS